MPNKRKRFQQILDVSKEFTQAKDLDLLLEKILSAVRKLSNADAGSIYIVETNQLKFHHTQNGSLQDVGKKRNGKVYLSDVNPDSIPAYVMKTGEMVNIPDISLLAEPFLYVPDRSYPKDPSYRIQSMIAFPLKNSAENVVGVIQLINMKDDFGNVVLLSEEDLPLVQLFAHNAGSAVERAQAIRSKILGIIQVMTTLRDTEETVAHVNRVGAFAAEIYETWAIRKEVSQPTIDAQKDILKMAAMLHDVGKIAIPNFIRTKPGKLNAEEYETIKEHTTKGAQLLLQYANSEIEETAAQIALTHHEHWDGTGYPGHIDPTTGKVVAGHENEQGKARGKTGEEIPVFGRIVAIADVYDSLLSYRVYRDAWKEENVLQELKQGSGTQFDPEMIDAFFNTIETLHDIARRFPN